MNKFSDGVITLRQFTLEDAQEHLEGEDEEQIKWLSGGKSTLEGVKKWIEKSKGHWENDGPFFAFAVLDAENKLIGMVEANVDYEHFEGYEEGDVNISYGLYPFARGKGYASRAVDILTKFLKDKGSKRAVIRIDPENENSQKVPTRCGFVKTGEMTTKKGEKFLIFVKNLELAPFKSGTREI